MATTNVSRTYRGETGSGVFLPHPSWIGLRTHSDGYIKGDKYLLSQQTVQTFYRKFKCDLLNLRGVPNE